MKFSDNVSVQRTDYTPMFALLFFVLIILFSS